MSNDINAVQFVKFLIKAKQNTYAGSGVFSQASRTASKDLAFREGEWSYLDSYLGDFHFIGEEAVWYEQMPFWGMNYYGRMLVEKIPPGFGEFLEISIIAGAPGNTYPRTGRISWTGLYLYLFGRRQSGVFSWT